MNSSKSTFSIKDLENLSGIKAHTIRIWEKRYNILEPMRTSSNIRLYDTENLQKLLNITLLHSHGYKISKISKFPPEKIPQLVSEIISDKNINSQVISSFKMAMMDFDQRLFNTTYENLLITKSFGEIFKEVFIPLLNEIGMLWQTGTITPAHEHFISYLIRQKLLSNTEQLQLSVPSKKEKIFVLYLPQNEMQELGLMYLNYEILSHGYQTVYLGQSIAIENLKTLAAHSDTIVFVSYWTTFPDVDTIPEYLEKIQQEILSNCDSEFWILGKMAHYIPMENLSQKISVFTTLQHALNKL
jgi:DNA-binding transcriptional MerR regulator